MTNSSSHDFNISENHKLETMTTFLTKTEHHTGTTWLIWGLSGAAAAIVVLVVIAAILYKSYNSSRSKIEDGKPSTYIKFWSCNTSKSDSETGSLSSNVSTANEDDDKGKKRSMTWPTEGPSTTCYQGLRSFSLVHPQRFQYNAEAMSGMIAFSVRYNSTTNSLIIDVIKARNLKVLSPVYAPVDPFVRVYLLPDESFYHQTMVKKRTSSPKFNETFTFMVESNEINQRTLKFSVYDIDKRQIRRSLGHVAVPLVNIDVIRGEIMWAKLQNSLQTYKQCNIGEIGFSLCYNPTSEKIRLSSLAITNLPKEFTGFNGLIVKVDLIHGRRPLKSKESALYPLNYERLDLRERFSFCIPSRSHLEGISISVTVFSKREFEAPLGRVIVGDFMFARGDCLKQWQEMVRNPRISVHQVHRLQGPPF